MSRKKKIAILIKTCRGRPALLWVIHSILHGLKNVDYRIYISDERPLDNWKEQVYETLREEGHYIELLEKGTGVGIARNRLVHSLNDEELILRLDDDFELGGEFNLSALQTILKISDEIGFCGDFERQIGKGKSIQSGQIRPAGGEIILKPPVIIKKFHRPYRKHKKYSSVRYSFAEHTRNLLLLKREVVEQVKWNERLLFRGEHLDFMLSMREAGFRGAYSPDSIHYHRDDLSAYRNSDAFGNDQEKLQRPGEAEKKTVYAERWGCNTVKTKYPPSWYFTEAARFMIEKILT